MAKDRHESEIDTERIARVIDEFNARQRPPSGEHTAVECKNESRIMRLEDRVDDHDRRLAAGDVGFAELRKDVASLTEKVGELTDTLKSAVRWVLGTVGTAGIGALIWALAQSQKGLP
jgi:uncharacterized coiled-coil protein SlyX